MKGIIVLTREQELTIINSIDYNLRLGSGASRAVFPLNKTIADLLKLEEDKWVVKVNFGEAGVNQSQIESDTYLQYGDNYPLAEICAKGLIVEIMERVKPVSHGYRSIDDYCWEDYEDLAYQLGVDPDECNEVLYVMGQLERIFDYTSDNAQVGYNSNGELVAYDYGFIPDSNKYLCSAIDSVINSKRKWIKYINAINKMFELNREINWLEKVTDKELNRARKLKYEREDRRRGSKHYYK